jgi:hypothetical protein
MEVQFTTWDILSKLNTTGPVDIVLKRTPRSQQRYETHKKTINMDINDYLKKKIFGNHKNNTYVLTENTFPYNCESDIKHMILWINPDANPSLKEIDSFIKKKYANQKVIYFENVDKNKSVSGIKHFQLFIKCDYKKEEPAPSL